MKIDNSKLHTKITELVLLAVNNNHSISDYQIVKETGISTNIVVTKLAGLRKIGLVFRSSRAVYWPTKAQADEDTVIYGNVSPKHLADHRRSGKPVPTKKELEAKNDGVADTRISKIYSKSLAPTYEVVWPATVVVTKCLSVQTPGNLYQGMNHSPVRTGSQDYLKHVKAN